MSVAIRAFLFEMQEFISKYINETSSVQWLIHRRNGIIVWKHDGPSETDQEEKNMISTTTPSIEGKRIVEYKGIVFGEVVSGVNFISDMAAGLRNIFGGRSKGYENELIEARENAIREMEQRAEALGANAVIGVDIDYEVLGADNGMMMVTASGTAVVVD